ncbi:hypothetical protein [uncultured Sunxiuqinia sp.]|uniref:hypothetical protein n=1 Tax=uncultured Sunxiuqinia sp. TaxID=1573825 RepID=UPI002632A1F1|nr:hypothetical protein [uncultured Sunxiuqinia sp.]
MTPDKKEFKYEFNKWLIEEIDISYVSSSRIDFDIVISDPQNKIRRMKENFIQNRKFGHFDTLDIGLIIQSIDLFHSIAKYNNWIEFDIQMESNKLRQENEQLKAKIKKLKNNCR